MENTEVLNSIEQIVSTVRLALKTDADTALALVELNAYLMDAAKESRDVLREVLTEHCFRHVATPMDWEHTKKFCCQHKSGVFVLEYPDRLIVISDGELQGSDGTAERPFRVWYRMPCGES